MPDGCEACPGWDDSVDGDADGVPDTCDPCPLDNPDDSDGDGVCDSEQGPGTTEGTGTGGGSSSGDKGDKEGGGCNTANTHGATMGWWVPLLSLALVRRRRKSSHGAA